MARKIYVGDSSNKSRKVSKVYIGDANGSARLVSKVYIGDASGKARLVYPEAVPSSKNYGTKTIYLGLGESGSVTYTLSNITKVTKATFYLGSDDSSVRMLSLAIIYFDSTGAEVYRESDSDTQTSVQKTFTLDGTKNIKSIQINIQTLHASYYSINNFTVTGNVE